LIETLDLIDPLDDGALDHVSLAFAGDTGTEVLCVVNRLPRQFADDADRLARFHEQTVLARLLSHSNLVAFHAVGQIDRATFVEPHQYAEGVSYVIVNGQVVLDAGVHTGRLPGRVLRGPGYPRN